MAVLCAERNLAARIPGEFGAWMGSERATHDLGRPGEVRKAVTAGSGAATFVSPVHERERTTYSGMCHSRANLPYAYTCIESFDDKSCISRVKSCSLFDSRASSANQILHLRWYYFYEVFANGLAAVPRRRDFQSGC